jgi:hypothetical protein
VLESHGAAQSAASAKLAAAAAVVALTTAVVFGAVWIETPASAYLLAMGDIERFECGGGFMMTKRLSDPPRLEDFASMTLPDVDLKALRSCRSGNCGITLTNGSMDGLSRDIDWSSPTAIEAARELTRRRCCRAVNPTSGDS